VSLLERDPVVAAPPMPPATSAPRHAAPVKASTVLPTHRLGVLPLLAAHRSRVAVSLAVIVAILAAGILVARSGGPEPLVLSLDGTTTLVSSSAATVGDLLQAQGVTLTAHDVVTPAPGTDLSGVHEVTVAYGRQVVVTVDGRTQTLWTTSEDVAGLLGELNVSGSAYVSQSPLAPLPLTGATLTIRSAKTVTLVADGSAQPLTTTATTVGQALADAGAGYQRGDQLSAPLTAPVVAGATYRLVRVQVSDQVQQSTIQATVTWVKRSSLPAGSSELITSGADGVRQRTLRMRYQDGIAVTSTVVSDKVISAPTGWVIAVGTGAVSGSSGIGIAGVTYETTFVPATGKVVGRAPNFHALAMCETHARPRAVNPSGKYRGMYQFDLKTWHGVGGVGDPIDATPAEQTYRAQLLYDNRGRAPWPYCGRFL
jgi:uncharacterized protein YabE (DUF348 family)